jgi:hypothetical protein
MSDTEEVVIPRSKKEKVNTKPEIAREKLKEKRIRLKNEKDNMLIEEAKKRIISDTEKKQQEEVLIKKQEEEKKNSDPTYALMMRMEQMMSMMNTKPSEPVPAPKKRSKKVVIPEVVPDEEEEKPKRKPRVVKQPKPIENVPKRKKKLVYLQQDPIPEQSTQFVGYDIAPPQEPIQYQPSSGLLSAMMGRRNMNSYQY